MLNHTLWLKARILRLVQYAPQLFWLCGLVRGWGRGDGSVQAMGKHTHTCSSICTSSRHARPPLTQMECMCMYLSTVHASGDAQAHSPTTFAAWFWMAQNLIKDCSPGVGDPCAKLHTNILLWCLNYVVMCKEAVVSYVSFVYIHMLEGKSIWFCSKGESHWK